MLVATWITAIAALLTAIVNDIGGIRHKRLDDLRFAAHARRIQKLSCDEAEEAE
jgi:hypothetical protein